MSTTTTEIPYYFGPMTGGLPSLSGGWAGAVRVGIPIYYGAHLYRLEAQMVSAELVSLDKFVATFSVDTDVDFELTLVAKQVEQGAKFEAGQFFLNYHISRPTPRAHFVASTLMAIFSLGHGFHLKIPELEFDQRLNIEVPLLEISQLLQRRQMAYRLMVIQKSAGVEIFLPSSISAADKNSMAFVYHAVVDRCFVWQSGRHEASFPARKQWLDLISPGQKPFRFPHIVESFDEIVLGQSINLGRAAVTIEDAVVKDINAIREELASDDGHEVRIEIESLSGQVIYDFPEAPRLPSSPWDSKIKGLIDLDPQLDSALFEDYNELAAATLAGLDEDEKAEITGRSEIGDAFLIDDSATELI